MDELKISDIALDESIVSLKKYCSKQLGRVEDFLYEIKALSEEWEGSNFDSLMSDAQLISRLTSQSIESIEEKYKQCLERKIALFRARPSFNGAPVGSNSSHGGFSDSSSGKNTPQCLFNRIFEKHNKDLVTHIYFYLRRIRFYVPNDRISFYDPDGRYKRGLYKNIMAIDINSENCESDLLWLTGQHLFFQMRHLVNANLLRSLSMEMNSQSFAHEQAFLDLAKKIQLGTGINYRYLTFANDNERLNFNFFTHCFHSYISDNQTELDKYKRYFSNSYYQFKEILTNMGSVK